MSSNFPQEVYHSRRQIKYSKDKMWYLAKLVRPTASILYHPSAESHQTIISIFFTTCSKMIEAETGFKQLLMDVLVGISVFGGNQQC